MARDKQAHTFLSVEEKRRLKVLADSAGLTESAWLRAQVAERWNERSCSVMPSKNVGTNVLSR